MTTDPLASQNPGPLSDGERVMVALSECWRLWQKGRAPLHPARVDPLLALQHAGVDEHDMLTRDSVGWTLWLRDGSVVRHDRGWAYPWRRFTADRLDQWWFYSEMTEFLHEFGPPDEAVDDAPVEADERPPLSETHARSRWRRRAAPRSRRPD